MTNTLDELARGVLETIEEHPEPVSAEALESESDLAQAELEERLAQLVDNGLVHESDQKYELTENGLRVLSATPIGARDNRIDTPARVDDAIEDFSLRPDEEAAVRNAFSFLRYWGEATTAELVDGAYSESPAGYETVERWLDDCVRDRLAALPDVRFDSDESITGTWYVEGQAVIEQPDEDGRAVDDPVSSPPPFGSVRHSLEMLDLSDAEQRAARVAFEGLFERGVTSDAELTERVFDDYPAGYESPETWVNWLSDTFDEVPGVDQEVTADSRGETEELPSERDVVWTYSPSLERSDSW